MDLRRIGWDRLLGGALLLSGSVLGTVVGQIMFGRPAPGAIYPSDLYLFAGATLAGGWGLPLLFRGRPRRILVILLAVETPFVVWIAMSMVRSLPN